jgi:hypothetical protein
MKVSLDHIAHASDLYRQLCEVFMAAAAQREAAGVSYDDGVRIDVAAYAFLGRTVAAHALVAIHEDEREKYLAVFIEGWAERMFAAADIILGRIVEAEAPR